MLPDAATNDTANATSTIDELEQQLLEGVLVESEPDEFELDLYGFSDFGYRHLLEKFPNEYPWSSFAIGNVNLYAAAELGDNWRSLTEIRFTYLPHGQRRFPDEQGNISRLDGTVGDYTDFGRPFRVGGISLERVWLEHTFHPLLTLRGGQWLTPYGIWNVDHGSPVVIGVRRPYVVGDLLFPRSQSGLQAYGVHNFERLRVGYHLTLSNGRGPIDTYQDFDHDKALGYRAFVSADTDLGTLTFGTSGYLGRFTDRTVRLVTNDDGLSEQRYDIFIEYDEVSLAADLRWEWQGFLFQTEAISNDVVFRDDHRYVDFFSAGGPPGFFPDYRRFGMYALTGYRFEWAGLMPFAGLEYFDPGHSPYGDLMAFWGGINLRPTPRIVLKAQLTRSWLHGDSPHDDSINFSALDLQGAWSF